MPVRSNTARYLDPVPASNVPDAIDQLARQVWVDDGLTPVHALSGDPESTELGREYGTRCNETLNASEGAMLTTRDVSCRACKARGR